MKCTTCGNELREDVKFCTRCGTKVEIGNTILNENIDINEQPPVFNTKEEKNWFCILNDEQSGPYSKRELKDLYQGQKIKGNNLVWKSGMADWQRLDQCDVFNDLHDQSQPPLRKGDHVNNAWIWALAFAPIISSVVFELIGSSYLRSELMKGNYDIESLRSTLENINLLITVVINIGFSYMDDRTLKKCGYDTKQLGSYIIIPVYMYKRAKELNQNLAYFITWIVCFVLLFL